MALVLASGSLFSASKNKNSAVDKDLKTHVSQPAYSNDRVPLCHVLLQPSRLEDMIITSTTHLIEHILVCTGSFDVFKFVVALR